MDARHANKSHLLDRLHAIRRTIRARLAMFGAFTVVTGGVAAFVVVVAFDWLLHLPPALRVLALVLFIAGFALSTWYWVVRPLAAPLRINEIAGRLEKHFSGLTDRLTSTVDFLQQGGDGSSAMVREVVGNTERVLRTMPLESAMSARPVARAGAALVVSISALVCLAVAAPLWTLTGLARYTDPFGPVEWPRAVQIVRTASDQVVAVGESATVSMHIGRGLQTSLRGVVHMRDPDGTTSSLTMQRDEDDVFHATIDAITTDLSCWFEAGDDSTYRRPFTIRAVRRPTVVAATALVEPPPYAASLAARSVDLNAGPALATIGGYVTVAIKSSKPLIDTASHSGAGLRLNDGGFIGMVLDPDDASRGSVRIEVERDLRFLIELHDEHGFENHGAQSRSILAAEDAPPVVTVVEPRSVTELTPRGSLRLSARVEDDFGVVSFVLEALRAGTDDSASVPLTEQLAFTRSALRVEGSVGYDWLPATSLSDGLMPGDSITYSLVATDNRVTDAATGQVGRSTPMQIRIISDVEFEMRVRDDIAVLETRLREVILDQTELMDETVALTADGADVQPLNSAQLEEATTAAQRQDRLSRRAAELGCRFVDLAGRMERNKASDAEARAQIVALADALDAVSDGPLSSAGNHLARTRDITDAPGQQEALRAAVRDQETATQRLRALIRTMTQWGNFRALVAKTRDLLERQRGLRTTTGRLGESMLGKPVASLTPDEVTALTRVRRRQEQLAADADQLLERMQRLAGVEVEKDPAGSEASAAALRAARANDVTKHLLEAAGAIGGNRTAAATIEQKQAEDGLKRTLAALEQRADRELQHLRKNLARAEELVAQLIADQESLRLATAEAGMMGAGTDDMASLEGRQRQTRRNAKDIGEQMEQTDRIAPAGRLVRQSTKPMGLAERSLAELEAVEATEGQDEALALLSEALLQLDEIAAQAEQEALQRTLADIHEQLTELLAAQTAVNVAVGKLAESAEDLGRVGRSQARQASRLSREQSDVRRMLDAMLPDVEEVMVYKWALDRVGRWMDDARRMLDGRTIDADLVDTTERIAAELAKLIKAIDDTQELAVDEEFAEAESGGGGGGGQKGQSKPIPTVAELLVLRAMQQDINERTSELGESVSATDPSEDDLRKIGRVGEDQAEVRKLAEMVTGRAHGH